MDEKDYEIWDLREFFSIREAAALWCDVNPANASEMAKPEISGRVAAMVYVLSEAIVNRKLPIVGLPPNGPINREGLKYYAKLVMKKPTFLFPEERTKQLSQQCQDTPLFPCPGTKWEHITITLIADDTVRLKTPKGEGRLSYHQLGLADGRKGDKPKVIWELLKLFCLNNGDISSQNQKYDPKLPDNAKRLNTHLKGLFQINESIYSSHYRTEKAYKARIIFRNQTELALQGGKIMPISSKDKIKPGKAYTCIHCEESVEGAYCEECRKYLSEECLECHNEKHHDRYPS